MCVLGWMNNGSASYSQLNHVVASLGLHVRNQAIEESRPNKNLVTVVKKPEIELEPGFRFYRVITRRAGLLSVRGDLIMTPEALAAKLPPALVLQDRWRRSADP